MRLRPALLYPFPDRRRAVEHRICIYRIDCPNSGYPVFCHTLSFPFGVLFCGRMGQHVIEDHSDLVERVLVMGGLPTDQRVWIVALFPGDGAKQAKALHILAGLALAHRIGKQPQLGFDAREQILLDV